MNSTFRSPINLVAYPLMLHTMGQFFPTDKATWCTADHRAVHNWHMPEEPDTMIEEQVDQWVDIYYHTYPRPAVFFRLTGPWNGPRVGRSMWMHITTGNGTMAFRPAN